MFSSIKNELYVEFHLQMPRKVPSKEKRATHITVNFMFRPVKKMNIDESKLYQVLNVFL